MNPELLFLRRCEQAAILVRSEDEAELLDLAGLLRQMLLDKFKLMDGANKSGIKPTFHVGVSHFGSPDPYEDKTFWTILQGLDPETRPPGSPSAEMTRDQFLAHVVINHFGDKITIKDIIKRAAEEEGGVYYDPRQKSSAISKVNKIVLVKGFPIGTYHLKAITRVMLRGLQPIIDDARKRETTARSGESLPSPDKSSPQDSQ